MRSPSASNRVWRLRRLPGRRPPLSILTFLVGKPREIGYAEAGQLLDLAAMRFPPHAQMTLKQAATAVRIIDP